MPEIKHNFMKGKMNKDLDERLVPNGEYRDALNIQVSTSEGSDVGTVQNILGNSLLAGQSFISENAVCVGSIADEKNDKLYYFISDQLEKIRDRAFTNSAEWTATTGTSEDYTGIGVLIASNGSTSSQYGGFFQDFDLVDGKTYKLKATFSENDTAGTSSNVYFIGGNTWSTNTGNNSYRPFSNPSVVNGTVNHTFIFDQSQNNSQTSMRFYIQLTNGNTNIKQVRLESLSLVLVSDIIIEYDSNTNTITPVLVDTIGNVLKFNPDNIITGINIIDDLLLWTDNENEPKKINIQRSKEGTNNNGLTHTRLIVDNVDSGDIEEKHITVIKKSPSIAPGLVSITNVSTGYVSGNMKQINYFYPPGPNSLGLTNALVGKGHEMWIGLSNLAGVQPEVMVGDVVKVYRTWGSPTDGEVLVARLLIKEVRDPSNQFFFAQIQNNFSTAAADRICWSGETSIKVSVLEVVEHVPTTPLPQYYFELEQRGESIFERKLPRFAYRYKYEDGEYSSVGPFSEVVFIPGEFDYHPTEAYNKGMINHLKKLTLNNFITEDIPKDVTEIDLLYKNEFSPSIYVIKTLSKNDGYWLANFGRGEYEVTTENVYAQIPSNQLIRPWDNVPKRALSQEVTGNRVVYGNYYQNYDLISADGIKINPNLTAVLDDRFQQDAVYKNGLKSIKSQRTYNFGIVYGDEYGRETPVFTNEEANQLVAKPSCADSNTIAIDINSEFPAWADYYKIFIKETSNEYYNLAMGRMYDAEDDNVWLAFPSIDRNKVDEDTYLVLKKGAGDSSKAVTEEARYKVVAIENEAPDYIKTSYDLIAEPKGSITSSVIFGGDTSSAANPYAVSFPAAIPLPGTKVFTINRYYWKNSTSTAWWNMGLPDILEVWNTKGANELYVSFSNVRKETNVDWADCKVEMSKKYKVTGVELVPADINSVPGYHGSAMWRFKLNEVIPAGDAWYTEYVSTGTTVSSRSSGGLLKPHFYKKIVDNKPEFDGRFFVKIIKDHTVEKHLSTGIPLDDKGWLVTHTIDQVFYIADEDADTVDVGGGTAYSDNSISREDWVNNLGGSTASKWFIDEASFAGTQPLDSNHPKDSVTFQGQQLCDITSNYNYAKYSPNKVASPPAGEGHVFFGSSWTYSYTGSSVYHKDYQIPTATASNPTFEFFGTQTVNSNSPGLFGNSNYYMGGTSLISDLYKSKLQVSLQPLGNKQSLGAAFLKGAHKGSYDSNAVALADLTTDGGYMNAADSTAATNRTSALYLHLSFGGIGPSVSYSVTSSTSVTNLASSWVGHEFKKNWWVGGDSYGTSSSDFGGVNSTNANQAKTVSKLSGNSLFRLNGDANVYKIKSVTKRRLYNHQGAYQGRDVSAGNYITINPVFNVFEEFMLNTTNRRKAASNASNPLINTTNLINAAAIESLVSAANGSTTYADTSTWTQHSRMIQPDNCRLSYLIEYEVLDYIVNPTISSGDERDIEDNTVFPNMNRLDFARLEFVEEFSTNIDNELTSNPAIFETEPKEDVGLDIYHEVTGELPTSLTTYTPRVQNLIHIGATLSITPVTTSTGGVSGTFVNSIAYGASGWVIQVSSAVDLVDLMGDTTVLKFHNDDGTYATATWNGTGSSGSTNLLDVIIHPNTIGLGWFNCWSFGNGVESNRIGDTYNKPYITNGVKVSTTLLDSYKEEHRKYGLIYSGIYNSTSGVNDLNQFIAAEKITKDINPSYGSIQRLHSRSTADGDLIALCEDRILKILANKDALYNADGNPQLIANNNVLGQAIPFSGEFGISKNPESFASESYRVYFTDKVRGAVMRLSRDGLTPISDHGMKDWFRDNLKLTTKLIGSYDDRNDEYNITLADRKTLGEELIVNGNFETDPSDAWFQSGSVDHWTWDSANNNMFSDADPHDRIGQYLPPSVTVGKSYEISWTVGKPASGELEGRLWVTIHDENANYKTISANTKTTVGTYTKIVTVDNSWLAWQYPVGDIPNSINFHNKDWGGVYFNGTIDNISVKEIISDPITVSFKEDVKGWVSFKSFVTENALSVANDYYTTLNGKLYKHHIENTNRNNFYGVDYNSSVNVILNDSPGSVKSFHTLGYEGSQSRVEGVKTVTVGVDSLTGVNPGGLAQGLYFYFNTKKEMDDLLSYTWDSGVVSTTVKQYRNNILIREGFIYLGNTPTTFGFVGRWNEGSTVSNSSAAAAGDWEVGDIITTKSQEDSVSHFNITPKDGWYVSGIETDKEKGNIHEFIEKEGKWFNYIKGENHQFNKVLLDSRVDFGAFNVQGIGILSSIDSDILTFDGNINTSLQVGDVICFQTPFANGSFSIIDSSNITQHGSVTDITANTITVDYFGGTIPIAGDYIFFTKNNVINTSSLLGYFADIKFENNSTGEIELFSVGSEITESSK